MTDSILAAAAQLFDQPGERVINPDNPRDPFAAPAGGGRSYARTALDDECGTVMSAPTGQRNHTLNRAAFNLGQLVAGGVLEERLVVDELTAAADLAGLTSDPGCGPAGVAATIASGLAAAAKSPRGVPAPTAAASNNANGLAPANAVDDGQGQAAEQSLLDTLRQALVDSAGLDNIPEPDPLVDDILYRDSTAWLIGPPGNGKSFLALDIAGCVAAGNRWQGHATSKGTVLYLVAEGLSGMRGRVRAWESSAGHTMTDVAFLPIAVQAAQPGPWRAFCSLAAELGPALVVVDTQARVTVGIEENSAKDMGEFVHAVEQLRQATGACVLVVHHTGKSGQLRGSTALEGAATTIIHTEKDDDLITVECRKQKDAAEFTEFDLRLTPHGPSAVLTPALREAETWRMTPHIAKVLRTWRDTFEGEEVSVTGLDEAKVVVKATFHKHRRQLIRHGYIAAAGTDKARRYRLLYAPEESTRGDRR